MAYSSCEPTGAMRTVRDGEMRKKDNIMETANNGVFTPSGPGLRFSLWVAQIRERSIADVRCVPNVEPRSFHSQHIRHISAFGCATRKAEEKTCNLATAHWRKRPNVSDDGALGQYGRDSSRLAAMVCRHWAAACPQRLRLRHALLGRFLFFCERIDTLGKPSLLQHTGASEQAVMVTAP